MGLISGEVFRALMPSFELALKYFYGCIADSALKMESL